MLDIIGIGSLNLDFTITAEKFKALQPEKVRAAMQKLEFGAERLVSLDDLEHIISLLGPDSFQTTLGGSAFNTIHAIAALHSGIKTGYVGVAGRTYNSNLNFESFMHSLSIDDKYVDICTNQNCGISISVNHDGMRSFLYYPGCNDAIAEFLRRGYSNIRLYLENARILHITQFSNDKATTILSDMIQEVRKHTPSVIISCDPGYCWIKNMTPALRGILRTADFLFLNALEFDLLEGCDPLSDLEKADRIYKHFDLQKTQIIAKKESQINLYHHSNHKTVEKCFDIHVISKEHIIDATGAGDAFAAGFLTAQILGGKSMSEAIELGIRFMRAKLSTYPEKLYVELARIFAQTNS